MTQVFHLIKLIGAWFCIIAAVAIMILEHSVTGLPLVLCALSIAFSLAPE
jgi:hypothetical protein